MVEGHHKLAYGDVLVWISMCFKMATIQGIQRRGFVEISQWVPL